ncbi:S-layer protein [Bacillus sp. FJAT-27264]|uniref:S-layer homology domain-containing protein n=1 Tax=Paenibacillus sp. (strain DSM 101736 / FJAT-27264) TaxID=1850362 RepID=UPI000807F815|nr:S-layer homology domain-containing protein [Bacillus sp. FJAT-27264]OBZ19268.1 S-layer protein [Bacillus sp. FJAT-27264]
MNTNRSWVKLRVKVSRVLAALLLVSSIQLPLGTAKAEANAVHVSLGETPVEQGLSARAGDTADGLKTGTVTEVTYWETGKDLGTSYIYLDVDNDYLYDSNDYDVDVTVDYYDEGSGKFVLQYDAQTAAFKDGTVFQYGDSKTWKSHTFTLKDAKFADRTNGADIRLSVEGGGIDAAANKDLKVAAVTVSKKLKADSNEQVAIKLGAQVDSKGITARPGDGPATGLLTGTRDGKTYWQTNQNVSLSDPGQNVLYFYFNVADDYLYQNTDQDVFVTVEYYDRGNGSMVLQYDAESAHFKDAPLFTYKNTNTWKTHTYKLSDAYFGNGTNGGDFRLGVSGAGAPAGNPELILASVTITKAPRTAVDAQTKVYTTNYATQDVVIADGSVKDFGAVGDGVKDDTQAFQDALTAAGNRGGGVVFAPEGHYKITSNLIIPTGVTLRGDWVNPDTVNKQVKGTVLEAYGGRGDADAPSFLQLSPSSGVTNLSVWYPEQSAEQPVLYPWTFEQLSGDSATIQNVTMVNSYNGIKIGPIWNELHYVKNVFGTVLNTGIFLDFTTDIGRLEHVRLAPDYWSGSGLAGSPQKEQLTNYLTGHAEGIVMGRSDWEYMSDIYLSGFKTGMRVTTRTDSLETANAQLYKINIEHSQVALKIEGVNDYGLLVTDSSFKADVGPHPIAIQATPGFRSIVQFNQVTIGGQPHHAVVNEGTGILSFENSTFENWDDQAGGYAITAEGGSLILGQSTFEKPSNHILLQGTVAEVNSVNSGYQGELQVKNESEGAQLNIHQDDKYSLEELPEVAALDLAQQPKPATNGLYNVTEQPYGADKSGQIDAAAIVQQALNDAKLAGGGTVYLPAGIYRLNSPITVPSGVELRGSWDVPHHTIGGGTVFFTNYGENDPDGTPLITLEASSGVRGLSVYYDKQNWNTVKPYSWTIQGKGHGVYAINMTLINSYQGIDFGSYDTSGHYIDYVAGSPLKEGIFLGGGAEGGMVRNVQFNPHYYGRNNFPNHPESGEDFNKVWNYQKDHLDAFRVGHVKQETIFNTFVYGSMYGIHFEEQNGSGPEAVVIGHGTDGSKKGAVIDSAGPAGLSLINTELVSMSSSDKVYVVVGEGFDSKVTLFNTSMWGDTTRSFDIHAGTVRIQQANFTTVGERGINALGGDTALYNSYFQQPRTTHVYAGPDISKLVISNNLFKGGMQLVNEAVNKVFGTNLVPVALGIIRTPFNASEPDKANSVLTVTNVTEEQPLSGRLELLQPAGYAGKLKPVRFEGIALGQSLEIALPFLSSDTLKYRVTLDDGYTYTTSVRLAQSFAERNGAESAVTPTIELSSIDQYSSVGGQWKGTDDLSAHASVSWDAQNLYTTIVVKDDVHAQTWSDGDIWQGDSIQLGIDLSKKDGSASKNVNELGFALNNQGSVTKWRWRAPEGVQTGAFNNAQADITRDESTHLTTYKLKIPFSELHKPGYTFSPSDVIGFTLLINENDGAGRSGFMEYNQGIGSSKDATTYGDLILLDSDYAGLLEQSATAQVTHAETHKDITHKDTAANFVSLLPDGPLKTALIARLAAIGGSVDPGPGTDPGTDPGNPNPGNPNPGTDPGGQKPEPGTETPSTSNPSSGSSSSVPAASGSKTSITLRGDGTVEVKAVPVVDSAAQSAKAVVTSSELTSAFAQAKPDKNGVKHVSVQATTASGAKGYSIELPTAFVAAGSPDQVLELVLPTGTLTLPGNLLASLSKELDTTVTFSLREADRTKWSKDLQSKLGSRPAVELSILSGNKTLAWSDKNSKLTLSLPYVLSGTEQAQASGLEIWKILHDKQGEAVAGAKYADGTVQFKVTETGQYAITLTAPIFADLSSVPWAQEAIEQLAAKGIIQGVSASAFNPEAQIKRADFVKLLVDTLGLTATTTASFSDVEQDAYYAEAVSIAKALGLATGSGDGAFLPNAAISREEAAVFIDRALKLQKIELAQAGTSTLGDFKDSSLIAGYARGSIGTLVEAGLLQGSGNSLNPKGKLTRAETAVLLYRIYSL